MSITLDYITAGPVDLNIAVQIQSEADALLKSHDWWAEPISLSPRKDARLIGSTRIHLGGYGLVDVPRDEEALMVCRDTRFVVASLASWSVKYRVSWQLSELGGDVGKILDGQPDDQLKHYVTGVCADLRLPMFMAEKVLKKHQARKD